MKLDPSDVSICLSLVAVAQGFGLDLVGALLVAVAFILGRLGN